jgi:hypothetical protein
MRVTKGWVVVGGFAVVQVIRYGARHSIRMDWCLLENKQRTGHAPLEQPCTSENPNLSHSPKNQSVTSLSLGVLHHQALVDESRPGDLTRSRRLRSTKIGINGEGKVGSLSGRHNLARRG